MPGCARILEIYADAVAPSPLATRRCRVVSWTLATLCLSLLACSDNSDTNTDSDSKSDVVVESRTDTDSDISSNTSHNPDSDTSNDTSSDTSSDMSSDTVSDTDSDMSSDTVSDTDSDTSSDTDSDTESDSDTDSDGDVKLAGYGTASSFGEGGEICTVKNLNDSGMGSFRDCIENRNGSNDEPTPRKVIFEVSGTINLKSDVRLRQPYLSIDGLRAPAPGITLSKSAIDADNGDLLVTTWSSADTCAHDVLVQGIRLKGVWTELSEEHSQNAGILVVDGEDYPGCIHNIVFNRLTLIYAQDSAGDIWGSARDVTVQYCAFLRNLHPNTYSHSSDNAEQRRERISNHHNLYAYFHERGVQVRGEVWDINFEQNIFHKWDAYGFGGGYATRFRYRDNGHPKRVNVIKNHYTSGGSTLDLAIEIAEADIADDLYFRDNRLPDENVDIGTATTEFPRPSEAEVVLFDDAELRSRVMPNIGVRYRTAEEDAIFTEVADQIENELR